MIGRVVGVHIEDDVLTADGRIDVAKIRPICRLGELYPTEPTRFDRMAL